MKKMNNLVDSIKQYFVAFYAKVTVKPCPTTMFILNNFLETHPTRDNLGRVNASNTVAALERADSFLASISQLTDTCVIPSSGEVSSSVLPSKPLHRLMFKKVCYKLLY